MPRPDSELDLVPSVLDRLLDDEPRTTTEPESGRSTTLGRLKGAVRRDLEWLLNTKRTPLKLPADLPLVRDSVLTFGLPDFSHATLGSTDDRRELKRLLEEAVRRFEPRLLDVSVTLMDGDQHERGLRFRIDGVLDVEPTPEAVSFDSVLSMPTYSIVVQDM